MCCPLNLHNGSVLKGSGVSERVSAFIFDPPGAWESMVPPGHQLWRRLCRNPWLKVWNMGTIVISSSNSVTITDLNELAEVL